MQGRPKEEGGRGGGITFGSTPVVSVRAHAGGEDDGPEEGVNSGTPSTPSSRSSTGHPTTAGPFTPPSASAVRLPTATPPQPRPQQQQETPRQNLQQQIPTDATIARSPTPAVLIKPSSSQSPESAQQTPLQPQQHVPVQGVTPTATYPPQNTKSTEISARASPVKNPSNVPTAVNKTPAEETPALISPTVDPTVHQVNGPPIHVEEASPIQPEPSKSWASLFAGKNGADGGFEAPNKPTAVISPFSPGSQPGDSPSRQGECSVVSSGDQALGSFLRDYVLKHTPAPIIPRGLTNRSNWCFVNAILQVININSIKMVKYVQVIHKVRVCLGFGLGSSNY